MKISQNTPDRILLWAAFLLPAVTFIILRILVLRNGAEYGIDTLYHIRIADIGPEVILGKKFSWTDVSVWRDTFADKEMLYHLLLWALIRIQGWFGVALNPPFHWIGAVPLFILSGGWLYAGKKAKLSAPLIFLGSVLLTGLVSTWSGRMLMMRPHVISIAVMLFCVGFLITDVRFRWKLVFVSVLSFFFAWTYSNPHFIAIPVFCYALSAWKESGWRVFLLPLAALAGTALGLTIHPQFPNSWIIWKAQSIDAMYAPMMKSLLTLPIEMQPPVFSWSFRTIPLYVLALFDLFLLVRLVEKKGWKALTPALGTCALIGLPFTIGIFVSLRAVEYALPFTVLLFILLASEWKGLIPEEKRLLVYFLCLAAGCCCYAYTIRVLVKAPPRMNLPLPATRQWVEKNLPPGEKVLNLSWADFPPLFYSCPELHYTWAMDPAFSAAIAPGKVKLICTLMRGDQKPAPEILYYQFNTRYAILLARNVNLASKLVRAGWKIKHEAVNEEGKTECWVFSLDPNESARLPFRGIRRQ